MKKTVLGLMMTVGSLAVFAQADVTSAFNLNRDGEFVEAAKYIDKALDNPKAVTKEKTWRYRGNIYLNISLDSALLANHPEALNKSMESYIKARELDTKGAYAGEITTGLGNVMNHSMSLGVRAYNSQDYLTAAERFAMGNKVSEAAFDSTYTQAIYNAALSYEKGGEIDMAVQYYNKCAEIGYQVPEVYLLIANLYTSNDREEDALEVLRAAREAHPRDKNLILEELNIYLKNEQYDRASENLRLAIEADPQNEVLYFSQGAVNDKLGNIEEAEAAYLSAIEINGEYIDARYNLGALYYNIGAEKINEANAIPPSQTKRYKEKVAEAKDYFTKAQPHFEKAHELDPSDRAIMESLKNIYARTGDDAKLMEMTEKLKGN